MHLISLAYTANIHQIFLLANTAFGFPVLQLAVLFLSLACLADYAKWSLALGTLGYGMYLSPLLWFPFAWLLSKGYMSYKKRAKVEKEKQLWYKHNVLLLWPQACSSSCQSVCKKNHEIIFCFVSLRKWYTASFKPYLQKPPRKKGSH